jgi:hypothetical protein
MGDVAYAQRQTALVSRRALAVPRCPGEVRKPTRAHGAHVETLLDPCNELSPPCRP